MKRPSAALLLTVGLPVGLFIILMLPQFVESRVTGSQYLIFSLHVFDTERRPIPGAHVTLSTAYGGPRSGITDSAGYVGLQKAFMASGGGQLTHCRLDSSMRVEASGYEPWEASLVSLFGALYDCSKRGTNINHAVILGRSEPAQDVTADGSQPIRSETNRTSSAAGSRG